MKLFSVTLFRLLDWLLLAAMMALVLMFTDVVRMTHRLLEYLWRRRSYVVELAWKTSWSDVGDKVPIAM